MKIKIKYDPSSVFQNYLLALLLVCLIIIINSTFKLAVTVFLSGIALAYFMRAVDILLDLAGDLK